MNPDKDEPKSPTHPCAKNPLTLNYTIRELAQMLNRVQRHTKCTSYCLRRPKGSPKDAPLVCRFKYPKEIQESSTVARDECGFVQFLTQRNDELLNLYNPLFILGWRANVDFTPITSPEAAANYISKYCSKAEVKSESYGQLFNSVVQNLQTDDAARIAFQKLLGKLIAERDWSAQECMHAMLGYPMYHASRQFKVLNLSWPRHNQLPEIDPMMDEDDIVVPDQNWIDRYETRPPGTLDDVSLLQLFRRYKWNKNHFQLMPRAPSRIIQIYPQYRPDKDNPEMYENWCRAKLQLHHPY